MDDFRLTVPVLFIIFRRPDTTRLVFERIRTAAPPKLYVAADGPRPGVPGEAERCRLAREIVQEVDWPCEVRTRFRDRNLGCRLGASGAVTWFFSQEAEGIVLEDDCLPEPSFFRYCQELLEKYRADRRVMMITGDNFTFGAPCGPYSYYFSRYPAMWGWASWRRAWELYDLEIPLWPEIRDNQSLFRIFDNPYEVRFWSHQLQRVFEGNFDTWDYQWSLANWLNHGITATPNRNLISNIGFANQASHTHLATDGQAALPTEPMPFPLHHPPFVARDAIADREYFASYYSRYHFPLPVRVYRKIASLLKGLPPGGR
jgi:hypothetical protein